MVPFRSSSRIAQTADAGHLLLGCLGASLLLHLLAMAAALHLPTELRAPEPEPVPIEVVVEVPRLVLPPAPAPMRPERIEAPPARQAAAAPIGAARQVAASLAARSAITAKVVPPAALTASEAPAAAPTPADRATGEAAAAVVPAAPRAPASEPPRASEPATAPTADAPDEALAARPADLPPAAAATVASQEASPTRPALATVRQPVAKAVVAADAEGALATGPAPAKVEPTAAADRIGADAASPTDRAPPVVARPAPARPPAAVSPPATASAVAPAVRAGTATAAASLASRAPPVAAAVARERPPATASANSPAVSASAKALASAAVTRAVDPERVREGIARRLLDLPCSRLDVAVNEDLTPVIRGRVESAEDLAMVREVGSTLSGAEPLLAVEVVEPPFCDVLGRLDELGTGSRGPGITLNHPDAAFAAGDFVVVTVEVPADVGRGYLHVLFVDAAGKVVHLLPNPYAQDTEVHGGQTVRLGVEADERRPGARDYEVTPPYGSGMLLAILSSTPLAGVGGSEVERVEDLLPALASAVARAPAGSVAVSRVGIATHP